MDTILEKAHLRLILLLTSITNRLAGIADHICISVAFSLSPRKYLSGKFCLSCLNNLCKAVSYSNHSTGCPLNLKHVCGKHPYISNRKPYYCVADWLPKTSCALQCKTNPGVPVYWHLLINPILPHG